MKSVLAIIFVALAITSASAASIDTTEHSTVIKTIGKGGSCDYFPSHCAHGLSCVGKPGNMKCFAKRKVGEKCGKDPFWVCEHGLDCVYKICTKPRVGKAGSCNSPHDVCEDGLSCVGKKGNMKCFAKRMKGEKCGKDPFWVCDHGLSCVGRHGNMKCFSKRKEGEKCGKDPFWVCEDHLKCQYKVCVSH